MSVRSAQVVTVTFPTSSFTTGAATNADSLPTGALYVNGAADGATVTVTNLATGLYKASVILPTLSIGDIVDLVISATVGGVAGKGVIWRDTKDLAIDNTGTVSADPVPLALALLYAAVPSVYPAGTVGYAIGHSGAADILGASVSGYSSGTLAGNVNRIGTGRITVVSPVAVDGSATITRGDVYSATLGRSLDWTDENAQTAWPTLTGATITVEISDGLKTWTGSVITATGTPKQVRAEPTATDTNIAAGEYDFNVVATISGDRVTLLTGRLTVNDREDG